MKNYIFLGENSLCEIVVTKYHSVGDLNLVGVSRNNQLTTIVFKENYYVPPILTVKVPVMVGAGLLVNGDFTTKGSEGCMIVNTCTIEIFQCINSGFQC